ncbi:MAG: hypothetical protein JW895_18290, partial [Thermoleophilaceae bacterium]|nr:hypothetical protein [Thermoleophilaceae bacterium]
ALSRHEIGASRRVLGAIDEAIRASHGDAGARRDLEARLLAVLEGEGTPDSKDFACRRLSLIGSAASVPALAKLLGDERLAHLARQALERIGGAEAREAVEKELTRLEGSLRTGALHTLERLAAREAAAGAGRGPEAPRP